jgi:hypothetical protein
MFVHLTDFGQRVRLLFARDPSLDNGLETLPFGIPQGLNREGLAPCQRIAAAGHPKDMIPSEIKPYARKKAVRLLAFLCREVGTHCRAGG